MRERKIINGELCEQVTNSTDLHLMDVIYVDCPWHGGVFHRGCLIGYLHNQLTRTLDKDYEVLSGWEFVPKPDSHSDATAIMINDKSAQQGLVWRVLNVPQVQKTVASRKTAEV